MNKRETNAMAIFICVSGLAVCVIIQTVQKDGGLYRLFLGSAVLFAICLLVLAGAIFAEWLAGVAINRRMDEMGKDRMERELKGSSPYCKGTTSYSAGASRDMCPYRRPSNKRAWRAGWLAARRDDLAARKGA